MQSFINDLSHNDYVRLQRWVMGMMKTEWGYPPILVTKREADRLIESYGPKVKETLLKEAIAAQA